MGPFGGTKTGKNIACLKENRCVEMKTKSKKTILEDYVEDRLRNLE